MKYLKEEPLLNRKGVQLSIDTPEGKKGLTTGLYIYLVMESYQPMQGFVIKPADMRLFNKVLDILDGEPQQDGYWAFEDAEFGQLKAVIENVAPMVTLLSRYTPEIEDKLLAAKDKLPKDDLKDKLHGVLDKQAKKKGEGNAR